MPADKYGKKSQGPEAAEHFYAPDRRAWRNWLQQNHKSSHNVWLILHHKTNPAPSVNYQEAVEEAIAFGWIDSKANKRDKDSYLQYFARRQPKSYWSRINRERAQKMIDLGLMTKSGFEMIEIARKTGHWEAMEEVEQSIVPPDLKEKLDRNEKARRNFTAFSPSSKRVILSWILDARRPETRNKRIEAAVKLAEDNIKVPRYP